MKGDVLLREGDPVVCFLLVFKGSVIAMKNIKQRNGTVSSHKVMEFCEGSILGLDQYAKGVFEYSYVIGDESTHCFSIDLELFKEEKEAFLAEMLPLSMKQSEMALDISTKRIVLARQKIAVKSRSVEKDDLILKEKKEVTKMQKYITSLQRRQVGKKNELQGIMTVKHRSESMEGLRLQTKGQTVKSVPTSGKLVKTKNYFCFEEPKIEKVQKTQYLRSNDNKFAETAAKTVRMNKKKMFLSGDFDMPMVSLMKRKNKKVNNI